MSNYPETKDLTIDQ